VCRRKHLYLHLHWTRHLLLQLCGGLFWQWHHLHWYVFSPFMFPLFSNHSVFFQLSITAPFKPQTAHFIRRATTPVLERTHVFVNPATGDPIVIVRTFIGCNFPLIQTQILCFPAINYCTNGGNNCSSNATCTSTGPGAYLCQCNAASGYEGNGTYCARNYFLFLENPVIFSC